MPSARMSTLSRPRTPGRPSTWMMVRGHGGVFTGTRDRVGAGTHKTAGGWGYRRRENQSVAGSAPAPDASSGLLRIEATLTQAFTGANCCSNARSNGQRIDLVRRQAQGLGHARARHRPRGSCSSTARYAARVLAQRWNDRSTSSRRSCSKSIHIGGHAPWTGSARTACRQTRVDLGNAQGKHTAESAAEPRPGQVSGRCGRVRRCRAP